MRAFGWYTWTLRARDPGDHHDKVRFHPDNADSVLVPMLSLWPSRRVSDFTEASHCLAQACKPMRFIQKILWLMLALAAHH